MMHRGPIMKKSLLIALLMMIPIMLFAGPFGMEFGWTLEELENSGAEVEFIDGEGRITSCTVSPTKPHPDFDLYSVYIDSEYGIYMIRPVSTVFTSEYGLMDLYNRLKVQLSSVYGEPVELDEVNPESTWSNSRDLIKSIYYGDRILMSMWYPEKIEGAPEEVCLYVEAYDESLAEVIIEYSSQDYQAVWDAYNAAAASVL